MRGVERIVNCGSEEVGEDNHSESPGVVRSGAMAPLWPGNRVYLFPVTSGVLRPERIWYTLPNWQWVVPTRHLYLPACTHPVTTLPPIRDTRACREASRDFKSYIV